MSDVAVAHYVRFKTKTGRYVARRNFQNFFIGETRTYLSNDWFFAPYTVTGTSSSRNGDGANSTFVTIPNALTVGFCIEAVEARWLLEVKTVMIKCYEAEPFVEDTVIATEIWNITSYSQDFEKLQLNLGSPLDAVQLQVPKRVLNQYLVGSVPATGSIFSQ